MFFCLQTSARAEVDIPAFFQALYQNHQESYQELRKGSFLRFCGRLGLDPRDPSNRQSLFELYFYHDLLTGRACRNFVSGGVFGLPYCWHWVTPNPRHSITWRPENKPLDQVAPPPGFSRYKSLADADRTPSLYLGDLFTGEPCYWHPRAGAFHSFGWCSEREMAYTALVNALGYNAKVWQSGIHTETRILLVMRGREGGQALVEVAVDNSVDIVEGKRMPRGVSPDSWQKDTGEGQTIAWYNQKARSPEELEKLRRHPAAAAGGAWMADRADKWLSRTK